MFMKLAARRSANWVDETVRLHTKVLLSYVYDHALSFSAKHAARKSRKLLSLPSLRRKLYCCTCCVEASRRAHCRRDSKTPRRMAARDRFLAFKASKMAEKTEEAVRSEPTEQPEPFKHFVRFTYMLRDCVTNSYGELPEHL
jgi:hypothetical protein